ncbi:MAG: glycosyltransferase [Candidatus Electrothrix aestuarii]|uniref:Glycosyltransferase n=1 Tax=Candidatus Electrothrix aestuarii TaxID=3062594 RepID=A0AAU8LZB5_9BACT|nr:glycosyltransferase [Candidatus Electrothrix aestuarii]
MKQLKVLFSLLGDQNKASSRVRGFWIAEELEKQGIQCRILHGSIFKTSTQHLIKLRHYDIIYFQKNCSKWHVILMKLANRLGKKTLFDLDDFPSKVNSPITLYNAGRMMMQASAVMAGSPALVEYAQQYNSNAVLLPTSVQLKHYTPLKKSTSKKTVCLGWIGNGLHYGDDLVNILLKPLQRLGTRQQVQFRIVGACGNAQLYNAFSQIQGVETIFIDQIEWNNPAAIQEQVEKFDIGLYPLLDNNFNRYKCGFKALEYMAIHIPVITSPVGVMSNIIEHDKEGYLASTNDEWTNALQSLTASSTLRKKMGMAGRKKVENYYNIKKTAHQLFEMLHSL